MEKMEAEERKRNEKLELTRRKRHSGKEIGNCRRTSSKVQTGIGENRNQEKQKN